jgi:competence protein ComGC
MAAFSLLEMWIIILLATIQLLTAVIDTAD